MATDTRELETNDWGASLMGLGEVVTDERDIKQCVAIILFTRIGSDPMRPLFGCGYFDFIDKPVNIAAPNMTNAIIKAIKLYEKRVTVSSINYQVVESKLEFDIRLKRLSDGKIIPVSFPGGLSGFVAI